MIPHIRTAARYVPGPASRTAEQPGRPSVEELASFYAPMRLFGNKNHPRNWGTHKTPLTPEQVATINRLRATHTLQELGEIFDRHPSSIAHQCRTKADLRKVRSGNWSRRSVA